MFIVYAIVGSSGGGGVRYVGVTGRKLTRRLAQHCAAARGQAGRLSPIHEWMREELADGRRPRIRALARTADATEAGWLEREAIQAHPEALNVQIGGVVVTSEHATAIGASLKGVRKSVMTRMRMSRSHRTAWSSAGWRRRSDYQPTASATSF